MNKILRPSYIYLSYCCAAVLLLAACSSEYTPKPRGFQRFIFPEKQYKPYRSDCGFSFEIPEYAAVLPDFTQEHQKCWINVYYQPYNATLHISFNKAKNSQELFKLSEDARTLVYKHTVKADEIYETYIENEFVRGMVYDLSGNTASNFQFYVTDSSTNYMRGALYFNTRTNIDSITPVLAYLKQDVLHMLETTRWK
ncbi:MAG: gliding motility lipoprotein GldD [Bacteroidetes bacterium]|nr:MAG: gliding motility lipoprotein GldD [Bacteroidota bacterium]